MVSKFWLLSDFNLYRYAAAVGRRGRRGAKADVARGLPRAVPRRRPPVAHGDPRRHHAGNCGDDDGHLVSTRRRAERNHPPLRVRLIRIDSGRGDM